MIHEEMDSIQENGTWILMDLCLGKNHVCSKWVFKQKIGANGTHAKHTCGERLSVGGRF
jgi:hypothetical protein